MVCCQLKRTWERGGIWEGADIYVSDALSYLKTGLGSLSRVTSLKLIKHYMSRRVFLCSSDDSIQ